MSEQFNLAIVRRRKIEELVRAKGSMGNRDLSRQFGRSRLGLGTRLVGRQTRTARQASLEQETPGFALVDARIEMDLTGQRRLRVAVDNLLDRYYYEHLSVGNLPSPGRNIRMELQMGL